MNSDTVCSAGLPLSEQLSASWPPKLQLSLQRATMIGWQTFLGLGLAPWGPEGPLGLSGDPPSPQVTSSDHVPLTGASWAFPVSGLRGLSLSGLRRGLQPGVLFPQHSGRCTYWGMGSGQEGVLPGRPRSCQRERDRPGEPQGWGGVRGQPGELGLLLSHLNKPSGDVRDGPCGSGQPP